MKISFIIPTLNEVQNIPIVLKLIKDAVSSARSDYEIVFVDDKSTDGTVDEIQKQSLLEKRIRIIHSPERKGLGHALKLGTTNANSGLILFLDCDASIRAEDLIKIIQNSGPNKMLIGSRYMSGGSVIGAPKMKVFFSKWLNWVISKYLGITAIDISHSLRIFPAKFLKDPANNTHPAYFWELSMIASRSGLEVCEIPITFRERVHGISKNKTGKMIKSVVKGLKTVLSLRGSRNE